MTANGLNQYSFLLYFGGHTDCLAGLYCYSHVNFSSPHTDSRQQISALPAETSAQNDSMSFG